MQQEGEKQPAAGAGAAVQDPENEKRRQFIVDMMKHAWDGYEKYAWGSNELVCSASFVNYSLMATKSHPFSDRCQKRRIRPLYLVMATWVCCVI